MGRMFIANNPKSETADMMYSPFAQDNLGEFRIIQENLGQGNLNICLQLLYTSNVNNELDKAENF